MDVCVRYCSNQDRAKTKDKIKGDNVSGSGTREGRALKASLFTSDFENGDRDSRSSRACKRVN